MTTFLTDGGRAAARSPRADRPLVARRHRRRDAVVDRGRADPAGDRGRWLAGRRTSRAASGSRRRAFFWPLVAYAALTLASAGFSLDPEVSFTDCKQLVLLMLVPITYDFARGARANSVLSIVLTIGAASAFVGIVQYAVLNFDGLGRRPQGTLSHWMTYSGTLMLVICAATARLLYGSSGRLWAAFVMPALLVALSLTLTRGAWVGVAVGVARAACSARTSGCSR